MDGVDSVIADFGKNPPSLIYSRTFPYPLHLRKMLESIVAEGGNVEKVTIAHYTLGEFLAEVALKSIKDSGARVIAVGSHGQTIFHHPFTKKSGLRGGTLQIGEPWFIAIKTGLPVYYNFRNYFVSKGEEGAPLAHILHKYVFWKRGKKVAVLNVGGIANISLINPEGRVLSFDTGPGMGPVDETVKLMTRGKKNYDTGGIFSRKGRVNKKILKNLIRHPYFRKKPPKSTGKETFGKQFVLDILKKFPEVKGNWEDLIRTFLELTALTIAKSIENYAPQNLKEVVVCGGGARHPVLFERLIEIMADVKFIKSDEAGVPVDYVEGLLIAYLAFLAYRKKFPCSLITPV